MLVVVDHLTRIAHLFPCTKEIRVEETTRIVLQGVTVHMAFRVFWLVKETRVLSAFLSDTLAMLRN
jgi:hypothetical protein